MAAGDASSEVGNLRRKRYLEVAEHLELQIFSGKLAEGSKIASERELMERFGVGRSTVREALFTLQRKGLLSARAGAARHLLSQPEGIRHLQHARALLEVGLARDVALHASEADLQTLSAALQANQDAIEGDQKRFEHSDLMFHYTLAMISHNPIFTSLNHALNEWLAEQRSMSARAGATRAEVYEQHKSIHNAIMRRDAPAAQAAMEAHLAAVYRNYWRAYQPRSAGRALQSPADRDIGSKIDD
jgi:GntR family transcriptional regulator, sialic acid-inducible nan operon repressor